LEPDRVAQALDEVVQRARQKVAIPMRKSTPLQLRSELCIQRMK